MYITVFVEKLSKNKFQLERWYRHNDKVEEFIPDSSIDISNVSSKTRKILLKHYKSYVDNKLLFICQEYGLPEYQNNNYRIVVVPTLF